MGSIVRRGKKLYLRYRETDGTERMRLARGCSSKDDARPLLAEIERRIQRGELGVPEITEEDKARAAISVEDMCEAFLKKVSNPKIKDLAVYKKEQRSTLSTRVWPILGDMVASKLTKKDVERMRDELGTAGTEEDDDEEPYSARSIALAMASLSASYEWALTNGVVSGTNPVRGVSRPTPPEAKEHLEYLGPHDVATLLQHAEKERPELYPMIAACLYLGLRKGEALGLRWRDVRFQLGNVDVCRSYDKAPKSGKSRQVPINAELAPVLRAWEKECPATPEGLVFPIKGKAGAYRAGKRFDELDVVSVYKGAGLTVPRAPWHCLRHTFASTAVMSGVSIYDVSKLLGHSTVVLTEKVYAHLAPSYLAGQVAKLSYRVQVADVVDINTARQAG